MYKLKQVILIGIREGWFDPNPLDQHTYITSNDIKYGRIFWDLVAEYKLNRRPIFSCHDLFENYPELLNFTKIEKYLYGMEENDELRTEK